ncbi:putative lipase involved disintegration of autophagic bodies [Novosphingobium hassiacum]|uniref:Putative lipase involved disintegration of autophagic bodies n=1 Tax=Novosphingobium hassiacum TaxID=173676 RepID=A0A7W6EX61_9SPHN|nr:hypothetical protein [Novosphingobium hassiacum]MBB3861931.1 putative lipase involved disintegration of autophagic bodies [Novosphingobium hassiacum]
MTAAYADMHVLLCKSNMRKELVEIYSDASNAAIIRHPGRKFPGILIQGDTLRNLSRMASNALASAEPDSDQWHDLKELVDALEGRVVFYTQVLQDHGLALPFSKAESGI